jgi:hypothetical protein
VRLETASVKKGNKRLSSSRSKKRNSKNEKRSSGKRNDSMSMDCVKKSKQDTLSILSNQISDQLSVRA